MVDAVFTDADGVGVARLTDVESTVEPGPPVVVVMLGDLLDCGVAALLDCGVVALLDCVVVALLDCVVVEVRDPSGRAAPVHALSRATATTAANVRVVPAIIARRYPPPRFVTATEVSFDFGLCEC